MKDHGVEPGLQRWTIRSLKPGKRERRRESPRLIAPDDAVVAPLLMYQRLMTARPRSHVEAAETNIASSFAAARSGAMVQDQDASDEATAYQGIVQKLLAATQEHPPQGHSRPRNGHGRG